MEYEIDSLDKKILRALQADARSSLLELARDLKVSGGTIHQRIDKMSAAGILNGYRAVVNREKLGFTVTTMVAINLTNAKDCKAVLETLIKHKEVLEAYYTTGKYALMLKVATRSIPDLHSFLVNKLQSIGEIQSTESFVCLSTPIQRDIEV